MAKKYLKLEDVRVYYDPRSEAISLVSRDPKLKGRPFKLTLTRSSPDAASLYDLLREEAALQEPEALPKAVRLPRDFSDYVIVDEDPFDPGFDRTSTLEIHLGLTPEHSVLRVDLREEAHTLVIGSAKDNEKLIRSISKQVSYPHGASYYFSLDPQGPVVASRSYDKKGYPDLDKSDALMAHLNLKMIFSTLERRMEGLEEFSPMVLNFVDYGRLLQEATAQRATGKVRRAKPKLQFDVVDLEAQLHRLFEFGAQVGIFCFVYADDIAAIPSEDPVYSAIGRMILMGEAPKRADGAYAGLSHQQRSFLQEGRGILVYRGEISEAFQAFNL